jgi:2-polyprenyl-3-methyl-5-hydroxy-6-metoxy-1,4-benzoquinol methylase
MEPCIICGSKDKKALFLGKDRLHAIKGTFPVARCRNCGCIMLDPMPTMAKVAKYYPSEYHAYARYDPGTRKERFAISMYKLFFGPGGNPLKKLLFLPFKHLLRGTHIVPGKRILDVGCGNGAFLSKMQAAGMDAYGVEFSPDGAKEAQRRGLKVKQGTLEQQKYPSRHFDVITLNHVFEHVPDPVGTLRELKRILKPGGRIIMAVPNNRSLAYMMFGRFWASLDTPRHLSVHTPKSMRIAAKKAGLRLNSIRYISFPFQFQASLAYALHPHALQPLETMWIGESRLLYWLLFPLVYIADFLRIGDVIEVTLS